MAQIHASAFRLDRAWSTAEFRDLLALPSTHVHADPRGFALWRILHDEAELLTIAVHPDAQGQGLGHQLMQMGLDHAATLGVSSVFLEVAADNDAARALYGAHGFVQVGARPRYYKRPGDAAVDALLLRATLNRQHSA